PENEGVEKDDSQEEDQGADHRTAHGGLVVRVPLDQKMGLDGPGPGDLHQTFGPKRQVQGGPPAQMGDGFLISRHGKFHGFRRQAWIIFAVSKTSWPGCGPRTAVPGTVGRPTAPSNPICSRKPTKSWTPSTRTTPRPSRRSWGTFCSRSFFTPR